MKRKWIGTRDEHSVLSERHNASGFAIKAPVQFLTYGDYVADTRELLAKAYAVSLDDKREERINGNAPFEMWPGKDYRLNQGKTYRRGVLLVHGLTDSPYFMRPVAEFFRSIGCRVMAVLLPGHGTQPGDLLDIEWLEWAQTIEFAVTQLDKEVEQIFLGGLSTGATLSLLHSQGDSRIRGLFLFSPALGISRRAALANLHKLYNWLLPSAKWVSIMPDRDMFKYESFPKNAAYQVHSLINQLRKNFVHDRLDIPIFIAASADDATVNSSATLEFMASLHHPASRMVYYTQHPSLMPTGKSGPRIERICSVLPEQKILSFSHTSIVLPSNDQYYGLHGKYSNCLHYFPHDMQSYAACITNPPEILQGEVTKPNLKKGIMRRLMYNPYFAELTRSMQRFIQEAT